MLMKTNLFYLRMVQLVCILCLALLSSTSLFSQTQEGEIKQYKDDIQIGQFIMKDGEWLRHGLWKSKFEKAEYEYNQLIWVQPNGDRKYYYEEIRARVIVARLESNQKENLVIN